MGWNYGRVATKENNVKIYHNIPINQYRYKQGHLNQKINECGQGEYLFKSHFNVLLSLSLKNVVLFHIVIV